MSRGTAPDTKVVPKIYAHRGASHDFAEHTREAYEAAISQGADGLECDVRLTKDGIAILWHDADMARATDSKFLGSIADLSYLEIKFRYPKVMKLSELLDLAIDHKKDVALETKHPVPSGHAVEREIVKIINERASEIQSGGISIHLMSFSWFALEFFSRLEVNAEVNLVALLHGITSRFYRRFTSASSLGPSIALLKKDHSSFTAAQKAGTQLFIWTVDESKDLQFCSETGVDVVITNKPERARKVLGYP